MGRVSACAWFRRISACARWLKCCLTLSFAAVVAAAVVVSIICMIVGLLFLWSVEWVCCRVKPAGSRVLYGVSVGVGWRGMPYSFIVSPRLLWLDGECCCMVGSLVEVSGSVVRSRYMESKQSSRVSSMFCFARR